MESDFIKSANIRECYYGSEEWKRNNTYISKSGLVKIKESPAHYKEGEPFVDTPEIIFGRAYHCFVLQPDKFKNDYFVFDDSEIITKLKEGGAKSPRATNDYKHWYSTQMDAAGNKIMLEKNDYERLNGMLERLMHHQYAKMLITKGIPEHGMIGELMTACGNIGVKFIPDLRNDDKRICLELKTTVRASKIDFPKEAANYDYHIQAALYADLLELYYADKRPVKFIFIAQEKVKPYGFNIFEAGPKFIAQGRYEYELLMQLYKYCLDNNVWPGYQCYCPNKYGILDLELPGWSIQSLDYFIY
jgi:exodeoxyribonuclease VIII